MNITEKQLKALEEFFCDEEIDIDWLLRHIEIEMDESMKTVIIKIDNMNAQEFEWLKP